jgi:hypothetical protein
LGLNPLFSKLSLSRFNHESTTLNSDLCKKNLTRRSLKSEKYFQMMPGSQPPHGHPPGEDRSRGFPPDMGPG